MSVQKPNYQIDLNVSAFFFYRENLQQYRFTCKISFSILCFGDTQAKIEKISVFENGKIEDFLWKKKPARCFVSSCDNIMHAVV